MAELTPTSYRALDSYLADTLVGRDPDLEAAVAAQEAAGLPAIEVAPAAGKLLHLLARVARARRILEVGTLGGYSTIWLARALAPGGVVISIEAEPRHAAVARESIARAGLAGRVEVREGRAADVLPTLAGDEPFDLVFIDADKESNTVYLDWAARLGRPGTVVVVDNIGRSGEVARADTGNPQVDGVRRGLEMLASDPRFDATALQTVDRKGWDGIAIALLTDAVADAAPSPPAADH
ncbi:O-methyltransferase [Microbacterium sp. 10M-3C3]|jgi:predicted O-methyltransferase YrrM|uniref:O-methyltransferase n=1 Tax=Microbacterium sp. 10M-3C3 TaxID=2483401 RepID=UPI000F6313D8|nr:O-methyltransferase [Microbacterium sp. 10M-3C3]